LTQSAEPIADYADTGGKRRKEHDTTDGTQPGDPAKAAQVIITAIESPDAPALVLLGADAVQRFSAVLDAECAELAAWRELGSSTGFEA
jgi:hypothetical protein